MNLLSVLEQTWSKSMVLNGNSSPTSLEKVLLLVTGATAILVFYFRDN